MSWSGLNTTKDGVPLRFEFVEDSEPERESAWIVHRINALLGDQEVGYLKISYIPLARWEEWFPTPWHFASRQGGLTAVKPGSPKNELWSQLRGYHGFWPTEDIDADLARWETKLRERMAVLFDYHVHKPIVDFIRVYENFRRHGIGRALYMHGARKMAERGFPLYASGIQSLEAQAAWRKFEQEGLVRSEGTRRMLDFRTKVPRKPDRRSYVRNMDLTKHQVLALLRARQREVWTNHELFMALGQAELDLIGARTVATSTSAREALVRKGLLDKNGKTFTGYETSAAGQTMADGLAAVSTLFHGLRRIPWDFD